MARSRAVDPFAGRRVSRSQRATPAPDPNAEVLAPGELARRVAAAMAARPVAEPTAAELYDKLIQAVADDESPALDAESDQGGPGEPDGAHAAPEADAASTGDPGGPDGTPEVWLTAVQAAEELQVDPAEVRRRCREGELTCRKDLTGAWRIDPAAVIGTP